MARKPKAVNPGYEEVPAVTVGAPQIAETVTNPTTKARDFEQASRYAQRQLDNMYRGIPIDAGAVLRAREFPIEGEVLAADLPSNAMCEESLRTGKEIRYVRDTRDGKPILINPHLFSSIAQAV